MRPTHLLEAVFMDRVLANPALHIRTTDWPTDIPLEALMALVEPDRQVHCKKQWYGWRERDQVLLYLTVRYGEAKAWVAAADVRALDQQMTRLRALLPARAPEDTCQVALRLPCTTATAWKSSPSSLPPSSANRPSRRLSQRLFWSRASAWPAGCHSAWPITWGSVRMCAISFQPLSSGTCSIKS